MSGPRALSINELGARLIAMRVERDYLEIEVTKLKVELAEEHRLNGMGAQRELKLMAELARATQGSTIDPAVLKVTDEYIENVRLKEELVQAKAKFEKLASEACDIENERNRFQAQLGRAKGEILKDNEEYAKRDKRAGQESARLSAELAAAKDRLFQHDRWLTGGVYFTKDEYEVKCKEQRSLKEMAESFRRLLADCVAACGDYSPGAGNSKAYKALSAARAALDEVRK